MYSLYNFDGNQFKCFEQNDASKIFPLYITSAGYNAGHSGNYTDTNPKKGVIFLYTVSGEGLLQQDHKTISLPQNSCCLIDCSQQYRYGSFSSTKTWIYHHLCFNGSGLLSYAPHLLQEPQCLYPQQPDRILEICRFFLQASSEKVPLSASKACLLLQEMLNSLLDSLLYPKMPVKEKCSLEKNPLSPAFDYIRKYYANPVTIEELAQSCHLSKYYFLHLFKELCGETPYQYLSRYRIDIAKRLLAEKNIPLHNIAAMVGYPTYANFLTQFKKYVSTPPESSGKTNPTRLIVHNALLPFTVNANRKHKFSL